MFDQKKVKELQNKSHVRGKLNKQFYSLEQEQLQRKRKQMKMVLDQQVQQRRRQKQRQRFQHDRKIQQEQQKIKAYYAQIEDRERKISGGSINNSKVNNLQGHSSAQGIYNYGNKSNGSGVYQSRVSDGQNMNYRVMPPEKVRNRSKSRAQFQYDSGDIPVMPLMQSPESFRQKSKQFNSNPVSIHANSQHQYTEERDLKNSGHKASAGNFPVLQINQQDQKKKKSKRTTTKRDQKQKYIQRAEKEKEKQKDRFKQRRPTIIDQQLNQANSRQRTQLKEVFGDLNQQLEQENKQLKRQIKKNQQAISLLMGAVKSNGKFDKFRVQAQKILHGQNSLDTKITPITQGQSRSRKISTRQGRQRGSQQKQESMLPKLKLRHQSIMHDYIFGSARKAHQIKAKTFK